MQFCKFISSSRLFGVFYLESFGTIFEILISNSENSHLIVNVWSNTRNFDGK